MAGGEADLASQKMVVRSIPNLSQADLAHWDVTVVTPEIVVESLLLLNAAQDRLVWPQTAGMVPSSSRLLANIE